MLRSYRGFAHELLRTGSLRAFWLQLRTGAVHVARHALGREADDPIARFFESYGADGFRFPDADASALELSAESCLVCGLCSIECARIGGDPALDPRDAVIAAARLAIDWTRLGQSASSARDGLSSDRAAVCTACRACEVLCPTAIPIACIQDWLAAPPTPITKLDLPPGANRPFPA